MVRFRWESDCVGVRVLHQFSQRRSSSSVSTTECMSVRFSSSELSILLSIQQIVHKRWKKTEHKRIESIACVALDICASIFRFLPSHDFFPNSSTFSLLFVVFFRVFLAYYFVIIIVFDRLFNRGAHNSFPRRSLFISFETHVPCSLTNILLRLFVCVSQSIENWFAHHCHQCTVIFSSITRKRWNGMAWYDVT